MQSIKPESALTQNQDRIYPLQTTFEYYNEKFVNFKNHVKKISMYYPDVEEWYHNLNKINFAMFVNLVESKLSDYENIHALFDDQMAEYAINHEMIKDEDLDKLHKYMSLFEIMLA